MSSGKNEPSCRAKNVAPEYVGIDPKYWPEKPPIDGPRTIDVTHSNTREARLGIWSEDPKFL
ncbi:MAG: hypothetical protein KGH79_00795 [Patescibacteria group bacterium]|nr:hypothetical protein [Patescibacteria group bacterium]